MTAKLKIETEKVCWRLDAADMALLRALFPSRTNEVARVLVHAYCERLRAGLGPSAERTPN